MPRVPDEYQDLVVFLYPDEASAEAGKGYGGTGFIILKRCVNERLVGRSHVYCVTCRHVARNNPIIRINAKTESGYQTAVMCLDPSDWEMDRQSDIAAVELDVPPDIAHFSYFRTEHLLTPELIQANDIGIGDDVFICGRFVDIGGVERNNPALRFGNISMMPTFIENGDELGMFKTLSFALDMHSRSGYSGSPVIVYRTPLTNIKAIQNWDKLGAEDNPLFYLLGVHWGSIPEQWPVRDKDGIKTDLKTHGHSGMTCVSPAWKILEILDRDRMKNMREDRERAVLADMEHDGTIKGDGVI